MKSLLSSVVSSGDAPIMVLFGGNPYRRHEVLQLISSLGGITAHGALSEEDGMRLLASLPRVDLVLVGGRYSEEQRARIRVHIREHMPATAITEPGWAYPYDNDAIVADVQRKLGRSSQGAISDDVGVP